MIKPTLHLIATRERVQLYSSIARQIVLSIFLKQLRLVIARSLWGSRRRQLKLNTEYSTQKLSQQPNLRKSCRKSLRLRLKELMSYLFPKKNKHSYWKNLIKFSKALRCKQRSSFKSNQFKSMDSKILANLSQESLLYLAILSM